MKVVIQVGTELPLSLPTDFPPALTSAEAVASWRLPDSERQQLCELTGSNVTDLIRLFPINSAEEVSVQVDAIRVVGGLARRLRHVEWENIDIGGAFALQMRSRIQGELHLWYAVRHLQERGVRSLFLWARARDPELEALLLRLGDSSEYDVTVTTERRQPPAQPTSDAAVKTIRSASPANEPRPQPLNLSTIEPRPSDVLICRLNSAWMYLQTARIIVEAVKKEGGTCAVFSCFPQNESAQLLNEAGADELLFHPDLKPPKADKELSEALLAQIDAGIVALSDEPKLPEIYGFQLLGDQKKRRAQVISLLRFAQTYTEVLDHFRPRSVLFDTGPSLTPRGHIALQISWRSSTPYYLHSGIVEASSPRSLPFLSHAVLLSYGRQETDSLRRRSEELARLQMTVGSPRLDRVADLNKVEHQAKLDRLFSDDLGHEPTIGVFTGRMSPDLEDEWLLRLVNWATAKGYRLILKPHPGRPGYETMLAKAEPAAADRVRLVDGDSGDSMAGCDVIVTDISSSTVEAVVLAKPVLQVNFTGQHYTFNRFWEDGIAELVQTDTELFDAVDRWLKSGPTPEWHNSAKGFLDRYNCTDGRRASQRAASALLAGYHYLKPEGSPFEDQAVR